MRADPTPQAGDVVAEIEAAGAAAPAASATVMDSVRVDAVGETRERAAEQTC